MNDSLSPFTFGVTVHAINHDVARGILREQIDQPIGQIAEVHSAGHAGTALEQQKQRVVDLEAENARLRNQASTREEEIRQTLIDFTDHAMEVEHTNEILERLGLEPVITRVRGTIKLSVDVLVDVTNNEDTTLVQVTKRLKDALSQDPEVRLTLAGYDTGLELSEVEAVYVAEVGSVQQAL